MKEIDPDLLKQPAHELLVAQVEQSTSNYINTGNPVLLFPLETSTRVLGRMIIPRQLIHRVAGQLEDCQKQLHLLRPIAPAEKDLENCITQVRAAY